MSVPQGPPWGPALSQEHRQPQEQLEAHIGAGVPSLGVCEGATRSHMPQTWLLKGTQTLEGLQCQDQRTKGSERPQQGTRASSKPASVGRTRSWECMAMEQHELLLCDQG